MPQNHLQGLLQFWRRLTRNQKFGLVSLFVLLLALPVGIYLSQKTQIFKPKASELKATTQSVIDQERRVAGIETNGKLGDERAEDLAKIASKAYQGLVEQGLVASPSAVEKTIKIQGGGGPVPTPSPKPPLLPPNVSSCGDITSSGDYSLTQDIGAQGGCINIHDTSNVNLDCQNHGIIYYYSNSDYLVAALRVTNVQNFSIKNCGISATYAQTASVVVRDSNGGVIRNNTIAAGYVDVKNSNNLQITNNTFHGVYQQNNSSFNQINNNNFLAESAFVSAAVVISNDGNNNKIRGNVIDGHWDGIDPGNLQNYKGADDGIVLSWETQDEITGNTINNNWDCGIETVGLVQNTQISNNQINNSGLCGVGAWYWNSWLNNTVDSNVIDKASYLFYMFRYFGLEQGHNEQVVYFKDNIFRNNAFLHQRTSSFLGATQQYSSLIDFQNLPRSISSSIVQGNSSFENNDFDQTIASPILMPASMILDNGGNKCAPFEDPLRPLTCTASPSPTLTPSPTSTPVSSPTPTPQATQNFTIAQGWSLVGLTVNKGSNYNAEDFLKDLNASFVPASVPDKTPPAGNKVVNVYRFAGGRWRVHIIGRMDENFSIVPGEGYFALSNWPGTASISGTQASISSLTVNRGWSIISFQTIPTGLTNAESVLQAMKNQNVDVRQILRWFGGRYVVYDIGSEANNFSITPGEGYFIRNFGDTKTFTLP